MAGWSEYKVSKDGGRTWTAPIPLDYSQAVWENDEFYSALVFAAVTAPNGTVIVFLMRFANEKWIKEAPPVALISRDDGIHWDEGIILHTAITGSDAYSGNAVIRSRDKQGFPKLLIQSSIGYNRETAQVNERQWWVEDISGRSAPTGE